MVRVRRGADFIATLVYADEPQVIHLISKTVPIVAVAVPSDDPDASLFIATTASRSNWNEYLNGSSDLRYLFTYPATRSIYTFDLRNLKNNRVIMDPWDDPIPEALLPAPHFFARHHTELFDQVPVVTQTETLFVDGDWELQEFGSFYQRYSDVYAFLVALMNWNDPNVGVATKGKIKEAFAGKPFEGGSSYLHFFSDLFDSLRRGERLGLERVKYASPGNVDVNGRQEAFDQVEASLKHFLVQHAALKKEYDEFRSYLSQAGYLKMSGHNFPANAPAAPAIKAKAKAFADNLELGDFNELFELAEGNALVAAKITLSYYRRLQQSAEFFAQGRVAFA